MRFFPVVDVWMLTMGLVISRGPGGSTGPRGKFGPSLARLGNFVIQQAVFSATQIFRGKRGKGKGKRAKREGKRQSQKNMVPM